MYVERSASDVHAQRNIGGLMGRIGGLGGIIGAEVLFIARLSTLAEFA